MKKSVSIKEIENLIKKGWKIDKKDIEAINSSKVSLILNGVAKSMKEVTKSLDNITKMSSNTATQVKDTSKAIGELARIVKGVISALIVIEQVQRQQIQRDEKMMQELVRVFKENMKPIEINEPKEWEFDVKRDFMGNIMKVVARRKDDTGA